MPTIRTPVEGYTGPGPCGLAFVDGQAEADDPAALAYARRHGYEVDGEPPHPPPSDSDKPEPIERPARSASKADWLAYANQQDPADHDAMTKEQLVEQYGG